MNARNWIGALALLCAAPTVNAEAVYVIEQLIVSVTSEPDGGGERIAQIRSGDRVEILERQDEHAHIRLPSGEEGWVKASYLSPDLPVRQQLAARTEELERVRKEKSQLEASLATARSELAAAREKARALEEQAKTTAVAQTSAPTPEPDVVADAPAAPLSAAEPAAVSDPPLFGPHSVLPARPTWLWTGGAALAALVVGFGLGWRMLDRRIRAKYGGLRIY